MLNTQFHTPVVPRNIPQFLRGELEDFIAGQVQEIKSVGTLHFFKSQHFDNRLNAAITMIYIANALVFDTPDRQEVFYTFYSPDTAPLSLAKCPLHFIESMTKTLQSPSSELWMARCFRYAESAKSLKSLKNGDVIFIPGGVVFKEQREYFFTLVEKDVFSPLGEDLTKPAIQVKATRQQFSDVLGVKVTASSYAPVLSSRKMAASRRFGDFIIAPVTGNSELMEIVGRTPSSAEVAESNQLSIFAKPMSLLPSTPFFS